MATRETALHPTPWSVEGNWIVVARLLLFVVMSVGWAAGCATTEKARAAVSAPREATFRGH